MTVLVSCAAFMSVVVAAASAEPTPQARAPEAQQQQQQQQQQQAQQQQQQNAAKGEHGEQTAVLGEFDIWALNDAVRPLIGEPGGLRTRITLTTYEGDRPERRRSPEQLAASAQVTEVAEQLVRGAFQGSIMAAGNEVLQALGYLTGELFRARASPETVYAHLRPATKSRQARITVHLPANRAVCTIDFIVKKERSKDDEITLEKVFR